MYCRYFIQVWICLAGVKPWLMVDAISILFAVFNTISSLFLHSLSFPAYKKLHAFFKKKIIFYKSLNFLI